MVGGGRVDVAADAVADEACELVEVSVLVVVGKVDADAVADEACELVAVSVLVVVGRVDVDADAVADEACELVEVSGLVFPWDEYSSGNSVKSQCRSLKKRFWCWL